MITLGTPQHQSTKAAARREADRLRKRNGRAKAKVEGVPHATLVDHAIVEAVSFCIANADRGAWRESEAWTPINAAVLYAVALDILTLRFGKNLEKSKAALRGKLGRQNGHSMLGAIPSTRPALGQMIYRMAAPADLSTRKSLAPPLPPQDTSGTE